MEEFELEPGEQVTLLVRKHWIVLFLQLFGIAVAAVVPLLILPALYYLASYEPQLTTSLLPTITVISPYARFMLAFWWLFLWMLAYTSFITYYLTMWIITTTRIVDIHQYAFFSRKVSSFLLNRVQDVTVDTEGFLPTILSFGSLDVETAGRTEQFSMDDIVNPQYIRDLIMREVDALNGGKQP